MVSILVESRVGTMVVKLVASTDEMMAAVKDNMLDVLLVVKKAVGMDGKMVG